MTTFPQPLLFTDNQTAALLNPLEVNDKTLNFCLACLEQFGEHNLFFPIFC